MTTVSGRAPSGQALVQAPSPPVSALTGFDPSRIDAELLAQLLWDFFGPHNPRTFSKRFDAVPEASARGVATYRQCAKDIVDSLAFAAASAIEARRAAATEIDAVHESAGPQDDTQGEPA